MKSTVERDWIKAVRDAKGKPNYGMGEMNCSHEEICGNKLEIVGPLMDSYLEELGKSMRQKLVRSKATGLVNPIVLFVPWLVFRHIVTLSKGYGADIKVSKNGKKISARLEKRSVAVKVFSPQRFSGQTVLKKRHFKKMAGGGFEYSGRSVVVITKQMPMTIDYNMNRQRATLTLHTAI